MTSRHSRRPASVYAIADVGVLGAAQVESAVSEMANAGIGTIQLRAKSIDDLTLHALADRLVVRLAGWNGELWIDDRVDLARILPFAGVHLGQSDLPTRVGRQLLAADRAIGWSTHDADQIRAGEGDHHIDWLALGPIFSTRSKLDPEPVVGLERLRELRRMVSKPLIAIGGIDATSIATVLEAGADSAAVLSAICVGNVAANCREIVRAAA